MAVKQILGKVTVTPKGEYSSDETYKRLDIVTSNGQSYIAKVDNTGVSVTDTNTWLQLVEKPEKGIDYFTEEDIAQLVSMVTDDSESEFNEYYNGKVSDFDSNASSKTSEFNSNYDEKVESFNTIFDTSTDNFDSNYETKLSAFNENASTQTSTFNSVVEQATSDFNSNASTLTETFNTNASEKTSAFNTNASEKTQEFNDNVDEKTEQITSQLDNYVQFDDYPSNEKAGVVKSHINGFQVSNDGNPNAAILSKEQYDTIENQYFISKGTLENIKDDYVESSTPVKNLNNSLKDITPKNNAEGTDNVFDDGLKSPLYALGGDGKSEQVTTTGSNKLGLNNTTIAENGITVTLSDDGIVTVNGTTTGNVNSWNANNRVKVLKYTPNTNYVFSAKYISGSVSGGQVAFNIRGSTTETDTRTYQLTTNLELHDRNNYTNSTTKITPETEGFITGFQILASSGITFNNLKVQLWYNEGNSADEYEPYTGGQASPSPDYPQEINSIEGSVEFACRGKNLLKSIIYDNEEYSGITFNTLNDGSISLNGTSTDVIYYMIGNADLKANIDYVLSSNINMTNEIQVYVNEDPISAGTNWIPINNNHTVFRVNNDITNARINITIKNGTTVNKTFKVMIEQGTQATSYEPYIEPNEVTFNLNDEKLRSVGDVKDELVVDLDTGDYYKVENINEYIYTGNENIDKISNNRFQINIANVGQGAARDGYNNTISMCSHFKSVPLGEISQNINSYSISQQSSYFRIDENTTLEEIKTILQGNNVVVNYQLQTPTTKKLGTLSAEDLAKLKTFKGYNNVTVNTNLGLMNIRFTYGLDIKKYVDNKIAELSAQLIEGE